jgi:hypothetical protein
MTAKSFLILGALSLASFGIANAKSYDIVLSDAAMAGATQLQPGAYKLKVEGAQVTFTDVQNQKSFTAPVKVENGGQKFQETTVETSHQGDMDHINAIDLAGSTTKLNFN